ncbi:hypothetical protein BASA62_002447 [Batrachochytrium salamandrivorans]|nr:hypothetical protein BASA62_002447 [Batrachochytrium salamandrivorans]
MISLVQVLITAVLVPVAFASSTPSAAGPTPIPKAPAAATTSPAARLPVSPDGQCGGGSGFGCKPGQCCSKHNYCGSTNEHCGLGCQPDVALCDPLSPLTGLKVSPDGTCGRGTNFKCGKGQCCSQYNRCGTTEKHCGTDCQMAYGTCNPLSAFQKLPLTSDGQCGKDANAKCEEGQCCSDNNYCGTTKDYCDAGCQSGYGVKTTVTLAVSHYLVHVISPRLLSPDLVNASMIKLPRLVNPNLLKPPLVNPNLLKPPLVNPSLLKSPLVNPNLVKTTPGKPKSGKTTPGKPKSGKITPGKPKSGKTTPGKPKSGKTTPGKPKSGKTTPGKPKSGKTTPGKPKSGKITPGKPKSSKTTPGKPKSGKITPGKPKSGKITPGKPKSGKTTPVKPKYGKTTPGKPKSGKTTPVKPKYGKTTPGKPKSGKTTPVKPKYGKTAPTKSTSVRQTKHGKFPSKIVAIASESDEFETQDSISSVLD